MSSTTESSTDDSEENTGFCCMHTISTHSKVISFSGKSYRKFKECVDLWKNVSFGFELEKKVAANAVNLNFDSFEQQTEQDLSGASGGGVYHGGVRTATSSTKKRCVQPGYHAGCYRHFCNVTTIKRAQIKAKKKQDQQYASELEEPGTSQDEVFLPPPTRLLRSDVGTPTTAIPGRRHVLPVQCIICQRTKYIRERSSEKRRIEHLVRCETEKGGQLVAAAELRKDQRILLQVRDKDLVAVEARYHKSCYMWYTKVTRTPKSFDVEESVQLYDKSYPVFCIIVEDRLIKGKEILRLTRLLKLFVKTVQEVEDKDASAYKSGYLKRRLRKSHPMLNFSRPTRQCESEFVYVDTLGVEDMVEDVVRDMSSEESSGTSDTSDLPTCTPSVQSDSLRTLYRAAQVLKTSMDRIEINSPWPPTSANLSLEKAREVIPLQLFNFLAWSTGLSDNPTLTQNVDVSDEEERRLLSISQDMVYLKSKARVLMPKHSSLAMAVRHLTGSAKLIGILNGLGHCISTTTVLEHDTALAKRQLILGNQLLPAGTQPIFTTLVFDNNDFGEETVSGKGTTHNTNGIIIQRPTVGDNGCVAPSINLPKSRETSFEAPVTDIKKYFGSKKKGPEPFGGDVSLDAEQYAAAQVHPRNLDLSYILMKCANISDKLLPSWTGFNVMLDKTVPPKSTIGYLPIIDASPTEYDTVYTIMERSLEIADSLGQKEVVVVFDQAIYAKAQQIRWRNKTFLDRIIIRLGAFHTTLAMLACIGKRFRDAGLENIMIESGIVAQGSINGVMNGHHYNRSIRAHKCVMEAMQRIRWELYLNTLSAGEREVVEDTMQELLQSFPGPAFEENVKSDRFCNIADLYQKFVSDQSAKEPTFAVWSSYIEMVENLLLLVRATREGDWNLHLSSIRSFLPWFFAYNHTNYARYLPAYWIEMCQLPSSHPSVYQALAQGDFAVQRQNDYGFSQVACDQTIEQTCNRDTKTKGGMVGFTTNKRAVSRWILSQHERSAISKECENMAGRDERSHIKRELQQAHMGKSEKDVCAIIETIECMVNPFEEGNEQLLHIASGAVATSDVTNDYLEAHERGDMAFTTYCKERLQGEGDMFAVLKKQKTKTFASMSKSSKSKVKDKEVIIKADRNLFQRLMIIAGARKLDIKNMLTHNLGPLPLSLANVDGSLNKTMKANLMHFIEDSVKPSPVTEGVPHGSTWIIDGMALLQELPHQKIPSTFGLLADYLLTELVKIAKSVHSDVVHFVVDTYRQLSIKSGERGRRAAAGSQVTKIYSEEQKVPQQWKKFLSCNDNKVALIQFLFKTWSRRPSHVLMGVCIVLAHDDKCHSLCDLEGEMEVKAVQELECNHEEADTRLFLHCQYAASRLPSASTSDTSSSSAVVIKSPDTDVFVIGIAKAKEINSTLLMYTGRGSNKRTINLTAIHTHLGQSMSDALIGLHCSTGCDSVSSFYGKSKKRAMQLVMDSDSLQETFRKIGSSFTVEANVFHEMEVFVCKLYGQSCSDVNVARHNLFLMATKAESSMPPTSDALRKHVLRSNYQAAVHTRCLEQFPDIPSPDGHGWKVNVTELEVVWGDLPAAPKALLELTHCGCRKTSCVEQQKTRCSCRQHNIPCTDLCKCVACKNSAKVDTSGDEDDEDSD